MIPRYTRPEMGHVWSDENKFGKWLEVELAATETLAENGRVPNEAAAAIRSRKKLRSISLTDPDKGRSEICDELL